MGGPSLPVVITGSSLSENGARGIVAAARRAGTAGRPARGARTLVAG